METLYLEPRKVLKEGRKRGERDLTLGLEKFEERKEGVDR